jgi:hypothetical protein
MKRFHQEHVVVVRCFDDRHRFGMVQGERLLAQDVLLWLAQHGWPIRHGNVCGVAM